MGNLSIRYALLQLNCFRFPLRLFKLLHRNGRTKRQSLKLRPLTILVPLLFVSALVMRLQAENCNQDGPLDVKACYGAKGDGNADDTIALQNAFNEAGNASIYLPAGTYIISSPLRISTLYHVSGARYGSTIKASGSWKGRELAVISGPSPSSAISGGMDSLIFSCDNKADDGLIFGGNSNTTTSAYNYRAEGVYVNGCVKAGVVTTNNTWLLSFYNSAFWGNSGDGFVIESADNRGENISFYGSAFSNNGGNGLTIQNEGPDRSARSVFCYGCSIDYNGGWGVQVGTSSSAGNVVFSFEGGHIEQKQKFMQNFGYATFDGVFLTNGANSGDVGYLIDNEKVLTWTGGEIINGGSGVIQNPAQKGQTTAINVAVISSGVYSTAGNLLGATGWTSGSGAPSGSCLTGSLYSNTSGKAGHTLYVCVLSAWRAVK